MSNRECPGPISCSAEVLPFNFTCRFHPDQYLQYQRLKAAITSQLRFDTMLRQRPLLSPLQHARGWWKYAIACVTSRPNSRPWQDIKQIGKHRRRYIELVMKKNMKRGDGIGFHAGLSSKESAELLEMEDALPVEALQSFHLVALRRVFTAQSRDDASRSSTDCAEYLSVGSKKSMFRRLRSNTGSKKSIPLSSPDNQDDSLRDESSLGVDDSGHSAGLSLLDAMTLRLGRKTWFVDWKLYDATINLIFSRRKLDRTELCLTVRASGNARSFGIGKRDFSFAISQCELHHGVDRVLTIGTEDCQALIEDDFAEIDDIVNESDELHFETPIIWIPLPRIHGVGPDLETPSAFLDLPPKGSVCRLFVGKDCDTVKLSMSAHPATLVWTTSLFDNIAEFFFDRSSSEQIDFPRHLRNAATPLARKAQLALLSPASLAIHLNVAGPKIWVPLL
jgi:Vacuolar sorting-associated protein 13, N-terminal